MAKINIADTLKEIYKQQLPIPPTNIATTANPLTRDQAEEVNKVAFGGMKRVELGLLHFAGGGQSREVYEKMPRYLMQEAADVVKSTGMVASVHAPIEEPTGYGKPEERANVLHRLFVVLDQARKFATPYNPNIRYNIHISAAITRSFSKEREEKVKQRLMREFEEYMKEQGRQVKIKQFEDLETKYRDEFYKWLENKYGTYSWQTLTAKEDVIALTKGETITNKPVPFPEGNLPWEKEVKLPKEAVDEISANHIKSIVSQIYTIARNVDIEFSRLNPEIQDAIDKKDKEALVDVSRKIINFAASLDNYLSNIDQLVHQLKELISKSDNDQAKQELEKALESVARIREDINRKKQKLSALAEELMTKAAHLDENKLYNKAILLYNITSDVTESFKEFTLSLGSSLSKFENVSLFEPFSYKTLKEAPKTFAELAAMAIAEGLAAKDTGIDPYEKIPTIVIEDVFPEYTGSRGEELARIIEKTREELPKAMERLAKVAKMSKEEAMKDKETWALKVTLDKINLYLEQEYGKDKGNKLFNEMIKKAEELAKNKEKVKELAEKHIGVTLDTLHMMQLLKHEGYTPEDAIKEMEKLAKHIKHIHFVDGWLGYDDSHLTPGSGFMPMKEIVERLAKHNPKIKEAYERYVNWDKMDLKDVLKAELEPKNDITFVFEQGEEIALLEQLGAKGMAYEIAYSSVGAPLGIAPEFTQYGIDTNTMYWLPAYVPYLDIYSSAINTSYSMSMFPSSWSGVPLFGPARRQTR